MNNFEKIKAMDIDEMAEFLRAVTTTYCEYCPFQYDCDKDEYQDLDCTGFLKQWLESEVRG